MAEAPLFNLQPSPISKPSEGFSSVSTPMFTFKQSTPLPSNPDKPKFQSANISDVVIAPYLTAKKGTTPTIDDAQKIANSIPKAPGETRSPVVTMAQLKGTGEIASPEYFANSIDLHDSKGNYIQTFKGANAYAQAKKAAVQTGGNIGVSNPYGSIGRMFKGAYGAVNDQITSAANSLQDFVTSASNPKVSPGERAIKFTQAALSGFFLSTLPITAMIGAGKESSPDKKVDGMDIMGPQGIATAVQGAFKKLESLSSWEITQWLDTAINEKWMTPETRKKIEPSLDELATSFNSIAAGEIIHEAPAKIVAATHSIADAVNNEYFLKTQTPEELAQAKKTQGGGINLQPQDESIFHGSSNGTLSLDENKNINFGTVEGDVAQFSGDNGKVTKVPLTGLKVQDFDTKEEMFDATNKNKQQYIDQGIDVLRSGNHAIGINPDNISSVTGIPIGDDFRDKTIDEMIQEDQNPTKSDNTKTRGFFETVEQSPKTTPELKKVVSDENINQYDVYTDKKGVSDARQFITEKGKNESVKYLSDPSTPYNKLTSTASQILIQDLQRSPETIDQAIELTRVMAEKATTAGQANQAISMFNKLTPEGILKYAQSVFNDAAKNVSKTDITFKKPVLTPELASDLVRTSEKIQTMEEGPEKNVETMKLLKKINDEIPSSIGKKIATFQRLEQLLFGKTFVRKLIGDLTINTMENIKDIPGTALDSALSLVTGKRTTTLPDIPTQMKGWIKGVKEGVSEAAQGIQSSGREEGQYDIPRTETFKGKVGKSAERTLGVFFNGLTKGVYQGAYDGEMLNQIKIGIKNGDISNADDITEEMKEKANFTGEYRTFQDNNIASRFFTGLKSALNFKQDFGIGNFVINYPNIPGSILAKGVEYSGGGFINAVLEMARPLMGEKINDLLGTSLRTTFDQKKFVDGISRTVVGTAGLVGTGAILSKLGIITGKETQNKNLIAIKQDSGLSAYQINLSALKRFVLGGFNPDLTKLQKGDTLVDYNFIQPAAISLGIGANINENQGTLSQKAEESVKQYFSLDNLTSAIDTLGEQPVLTDITNLLKYSQGTISGVIKEFLMEAPSSFTPSFLNGLRQLTDNTQRLTYSPNSWDYAFNLAKNRIPGLAETLPPKIGVTGQPLKVYQNNSNNVFNTIFNPTFATHYQTTPEAQMVIDLYNRTGDTKQVPKLESLTQTINGKSMKLTPTQVGSLQRYVGTVTTQVFGRVQNNPQFQNLSDDDKIKVLSDLLTDIGTAGRIVILGNRPKKVSGSALSIIKMTMPQKQTQ